MTRPIAFRPRIIGWLASEASTATAIAEMAIAKAAQVGRTRRLVLHLDLVTGRCTLHDRDAAIPPHTAVRGIDWKTDPDWLADELREEAIEAALIHTPARKAKAARRLHRRAA